ncbi:unnamed protein product [Symbiodinium sp. CCMP2592]|nr:unnamed protein product [Symbiodinium sp. CCMP2592]
MFFSLLDPARPKRAAEATSSFRLHRVPTQNPLLIPASSLEPLELQAADPPWPLELRAPWLQGPNGMAHRPSGGSSPSKSRLSRDADATPTRISPSPKLLTLGGGGRSPSASPIGTELPAIDVPFRGSASPRPRKPPHATHFPVVRRAERDASARTPSTSSSQGPMSLGLHGRRVSAGTAAKETSGFPHEILARGDRAQRKFREALAKGKAQPRRETHDVREALLVPLPPI